MDDRFHFIKSISQCPSTISIILLVIILILLLNVAVSVALMATKVNELTCNPDKIVNLLKKISFINQRQERIELIKRVSNKRQEKNDKNYMSTQF